MITPEKFFKILKSNDITFYTGVPDSLLKDFCSYVSDNSTIGNHIINSNEGASIALASGYYLATGKPALVYMQNSGIGNAINPLLSLADPEVYSVPLMLMIGWRGEPGKEDEPQHRKQGRVLLKILEAMEIPFAVIHDSTDNIKKVVEDACKVIKKKNSTFALVISQGTFTKYKPKNPDSKKYSMSREDALRVILDNLTDNEIVVSTTGKISREVYEYREKNNQSHRNDFLTVGSMGHCSQIAMAISMNHRDREVYVLDGDGSVIMHMGSLAILGVNAPVNFKHIVINNGSHDSVGGQPTVGFKINLTSIAKSCGYITSLSAENEIQTRKKFVKIKNSKGPSFFEIKVHKGARDNLGRPTTTPIENKKELMTHLLKS